MSRIDDPDLIEFLDQAWEELWKYDQSFLSTLANKEGSPWALIAHKFNDPL